MKRRIFFSTCAIALASLLVLAGCVVGLVYRKATREGWNTLAADAGMLSAGYERAGEEYLRGIRGYPGRLTLIAADGAVLFDDREEAARMENHAGRPEVAAALAGGEGRDERRSVTLGERTLYYALRLEDGNVLRVSVQAATITAEALRFLPLLLAVALLLIIAAALAARWQTQKIIAPVNNIDLDALYEEGVYEELAPLVRRIAAQKGRIARQVEELEQKRREFSTIAESMAEGLIVTDGEGRVVTINQSALAILDVRQPLGVGQPLLSYSRNLVLEEAARAALGGRRMEETLPLAGRQYRLVASPALSGGEQRGAVLLLMDDTERLEAERGRREFSANVSHELKTPLTSISGYAEILRGGLVKPEDVPEFGGKIYDEAGRLIALVQDIIRLSRLDEGQTPEEFERVDLSALCRQAAANLAPLDEELGVELEVEGGALEVEGVRPLLGEIVHNLIENAIRYNRPGGSVWVEVGREGGEGFIRVSDTGIGIPAEYQPHIFERFYRVDKSHARQSGGTGLGLAIVKRGALLHGGRVELASGEGRGSTFTVWLPVSQD